MNKPKSLNGFIVRVRRTGELGIVVGKSLFKYQVSVIKGLFSKLQSHGKRQLEVVGYYEDLLGETHEYQFGQDESNNGESGDCLYTVSYRLLRDTPVPLELTISKHGRQISFMNGIEVKSEDEEGLKAYLLADQLIRQHHFSTGGY